MIKQLKIQNFQSHADSTLNFSPGVNIIVGSSDSGKSSIIRALKWTIYGKPRGDAFCSWWGGETKIEIDFDNAKIIRTKEKADAAYILQQNNKNELIFKAFGNDVPKEICDAINMDDINLQQQGSRPFLIDNTPGEVAQHFNRMAQLEKIDSTTRIIQSSIRTINQNIDSSTAEYTNLKQQLLSYSYLETVEININEINELQQQYTNIESSMNKLIELISIIKVKQIQIDELMYLKTAEKDIDNLFDVFESINEINNKEFILEKLVDNISTLQLRIIKGKEMLQSEQQIDLILKDYAELDQFKTKKIKLKSIMTTVIVFDADIERQKNENNKDEKYLTSITPEICPFCESAIPHKH